MRGRIVEARGELVVSRDVLGRLSGEAEKVVTVPQLASAIHVAFCEPKGWGGIRGEVHERMHVEIATAIFGRL